MAFPTMSLLSVVLVSIALIDGSAAFVKRDVTITKKNVHKICLLNSLVSGIHPNPVDCHGFVECSNGITTLVACAAGLVYDKNIKTCQHARLTTCDTDPPTSTPKVPPSSTPKVIHEKAICKEKNLTDGIHTDPFNCNKFIECVASITYTIHCPALLKFDSTLKTCIDPAKATCDTDTSP